jgi:hypothetical protein
MPCAIPLLPLFINLIKQHVSETLKGDPEVCLAAVESGGAGMLQYCSEPMRCGGLLDYADKLVRIRSKES